MTELTHRLHRVVKSHGARLFCHDMGDKKKFVLENPEPKKAGIKQKPYRSYSYQMKSNSSNSSKDELENNYMYVFGLTTVKTNERYHNEKRKKHERRLQKNIKC